MTGLSRLWNRGDAAMLTPRELARLIATYTREHPEAGISFDGLAGFIATQLASGVPSARALVENGFDAANPELASEDLN